MGSSKRLRGRGRLVPESLPRFQRYVLRPEERELILRIVSMRQGVFLRELHRETGLAMGKVRGHIQDLQRKGLVVVERRGLHMHVYPAGTVPTSPNAELVLRNSHLRRLHSLVETVPGLTQKQIIEFTRDWGWPASTTKHRLQRLEAAGLVQREAEDERRYRV